MAAAYVFAAQGFEGQTPMVLIHGGQFEKPVFPPATAA
jgi:hypothetical protein